jgi:predicted GIY-YIG superfamily endonuclease
MHIWKGWNHRTPITVLTFDTVELAHKFQTDNLVSVTGHTVGSRPRAHLNRIFLAGIVALKTLKLLGEDLSIFKDWKPQSTTRHYDVTDDEILKDAAQFSTRSEWKRKGKFYQLCSKRRRELFKQAVAHMAPPIDPLAQTQVYVYEFTDHSCYVGLTCNPKRRHKDHLEQGTVYRKILTGVPHTLTILHCGISQNEAAELEIREIEARKLDGWTVYNKHKGGGLGGGFKYSYADVLKVAKTCVSKKDFDTRFPAVSQVVSRRKWNDRFDKDMGWPSHVSHKWTIENCLSEAQKFQWKTDWVTGSPVSYVAARKQGWLKEISKLRGFKPKSRAWETREKRGTYQNP